MIAAGPPNHSVAPYHSVSYVHPRDAGLLICGLQSIPGRVSYRDKPRIRVAFDWDWDCRARTLWHD